VHNEVAAAITMLLTIVIPSGLLAALSFFLMGSGPIVWVASTTTLRQTVTPRDLLGRVSAINSLAYGRALSAQRSARWSAGSSARRLASRWRRPDSWPRPPSSCARRRFALSDSRLLRSDP
jgi:hypothetical protein